MVFTDENGALVAKRQGETLRIEGWGEDSLRVRSTMYPDFTGNNWALEKKSASFIRAMLRIRRGRNGKTLALCAVRFERSLCP